MSTPRITLPSARIDELVRERDAARKRRDYETADRIRQLLREHGVVVEDWRHRSDWRAAF